MAWRDAAGLVFPPYFWVPAWFREFLPIYSLYRHHRHRIACSAIGDGALFRAGLQRVGAVGGAGHERVVGGCTVPASCKPQLEGGDADMSRGE